MSAAGVRDRLLRAVLARMNDIEEWRLGDAAAAAAQGWPRRAHVPALDGAGIVFLDVALEASRGELVCHEVNGPNAVGSDALTGESGERAGIEARQTLRHLATRGLLDAHGRLTAPVATVHAHQHWPAFRTGGEFYPRVAAFADALAALLPGAEVVARPAPEAPGAEDVALVVGDVPSVAAGLEVDPRGGGLRYRGRAVAFLGNPNLVLELVRLGRLEQRAGRVVGADLAALHGARLLPVIHDKALQQALLEGTGIRPLACAEAFTRRELRERCRALLERGPAVLKPNGGSGGTGVHVVVPAMSDAEIEARIETVLADVAAKYGPDAERFAWPLRAFEFVRSTGVRRPDGEHLWDLRIAVEFEAGAVAVYPVSLRLAPAPFDARTFHLDRDQWISNVSGRRSTLLLPGTDEDVLQEVGLTPARMDVLVGAAVAWTTRAWDGAVRDAGRRGLAYEDEAERADAAFYPSEKFGRP